MDRSHAADVVAELPAYSEDGVAGYHGDGTTVTPQVMNQLVEEIRNVLVAAGVTPSCLSDSQLAQALAGALGILFPSDGTAAPETLNDRLIIGSPGGSITPSSHRSALIGSPGSAIAFPSVAGRVFPAVLAAALNAKLAAPGLATGYSLSALDPAHRTDYLNHNLTFLVLAETGVAHMLGLKVGGDVDAGNAEALSVDEDGHLTTSGNVIAANLQSLGDLQVVDDAGINGDLAVGGVATLGDIEVPTGANEVSDRVAGPTSIAAGSHSDVVIVYNSRVDENSRLFYSLTIVGGGADDAPLTHHIYNQTDGGFTIRIQNVGAGAFAQTTYVDYWIVNPKPAA